MARDIFERLCNGEPVAPDDSEFYKLKEEGYATKALLVKMNQSADPGEIRACLGEITGSEIDSSTTIFSPLYSNYGKNVRIGKNVFINFNCTLLDLGGITIEDGVMLAPNVNLLTEGHPLDPLQRHYLVAQPILIKKNAWIGANATILSGVTIGEYAVVAAGAVVTDDVPDNVVVGGIPAKIIKQIL